MSIVNDNGGTAGSGSWTLKVTGEARSGASPQTFTGSSSGTTVTIPSGLGYLITDNGNVAGSARRSLGGLPS